MLAEADGRLAHPEHLDAVEHGRRQQPPTFAARRPAPRLRQLLEVADRDSSRDRIGRIGIAIASA
jgi:hypothetical protein